MESRTDRIEVNVETDQIAEPSQSEVPAAEWTTDMTSPMDNLVERSGGGRFTPRFSRYAELVSDRNYRLQQENYV